MLGIPMLGGGYKRIPGPGCQQVKPIAEFRFGERLRSQKGGE